MRSELRKAYYHDSRRGFKLNAIQDAERVGQLDSESRGIKYEDLRVYDRPRVQRVLGRMGLEHVGTVDLERSPIEPVNLRRELGSVAIYNARILLSHMRSSERISADSFMTAISEDQLSAMHAIEYLSSREIIDMRTDGDIQNRLYSKRGIVDKLSCEDERLAHLSYHKQRRAVDTDAIRERSRELLAEMGEGWVSLLSYMHIQMRRPVDGGLTDYSDSDMINDLYNRDEGDNFEVNGAHTHIRRRPDTLKLTDLPDADIFAKTSTQ